MSALIMAQRTLRQRVSQLHSRLAPLSNDDRGDVPGWVLVTLMTAGLVTLLWQTAGPLLQSMFTTAMSKVAG